MKKIAFLFAFLISGFVLAQPKETHWQKANLKGKVKSIETVQHSTGEETFLLSFTTFFNEKGFVTKISTYNTENIKEEQIEFQYDSKNNLVEVHRISEGKVEMKVVSVFDGKGNSIEDTFLEEGNPSKKIKYTYDSKRNLIQKEVCLADSLCIEKYAYKYDNKGNKIQEITFIPNEVVEEKAYMYDKEAKKVKEVSSTPEGMVLYKTQYFYDKKGNIIEEHLFDNANDLVTKFVYTYDKHNNQTARSKYNHGELDEEMNMTYEYDKKENWVKKTTTIDGEVMFIEEQKIEYY